MKVLETAYLRWPRASRLLPARYRAADCFERILEPGDSTTIVLLSRLAALTGVAGTGDLDTLDPAKVLFGAGAGWINASFLAPRPGRFSSFRQGAFSIADNLETCLSEVRHHLQKGFLREGITETMDLDYRALAVHFEGRVTDIRSRLGAGGEWAACYDPDSWTAAQALGDRLRDAGSSGVVYASLRRMGGACVAVFDPNTLRACRHDTYLAFRWNGRAITQVFEKRILQVP